MNPDCEFLFAALAEKHNAVIRKIREIPPWEWGGEFLRIEPQVLRFLGTFAKRYPECTAFKTAYTLASALAVYRLTSRKPKSLTKQERADCITANRDLVDEYSDALLRAYREIFNFLFAAKGNTTFDAVAEIIRTIRTEHTQTRRQIIKSINTRNTDGLDITGPRTSECRDQVFAVVVFLASPTQNTHKAYTTLATGLFDQLRTGTRIRTRSSSGVIGMKVGFGLGLKPTDSTTKSIDRYHSVSFLIPELFSTKP